MNQTQVNEVLGYTRGAAQRWQALLAAMAPGTTLPAAQLQLVSAAGMALYQVNQALEQLAQSLQAVADPAMAAYLPPGVAVGPIMPVPGSQPVQYTPVQVPVPAPAVQQAPPVQQPLPTWQPPQPMSLVIAAEGKGISIEASPQHMVPAPAPAQVHPVPAGPHQRCQACGFNIEIHDGNEARSLDEMTQHLAYVHQLNAFDMNAATVFDYFARIEPPPALSVASVDEQAAIFLANAAEDQAAPQ